MMKMKMITTTVFLLVLSLTTTVVDATGDLPNCNTYRQNLQSRINGYKNRGENINTVANFICDSSFRDNILEEINNGLQGTPVLTLDLTPRCEWKRTSDNRLCREIFAEENGRTRDDCIKHEGCIYDEAGCFGRDGCENVDISGMHEFRAAEQCSAHDCTYEPAPGTNVCIRRDLNGNFYNNPEHRNLLERVFRDDDENECRDAVLTELRSGRRSRRQLDEYYDGNIGDYPILDYVAIVLDANNWGKGIENLDVSEFNAAATEKKSRVLQLTRLGMKIGFWAFALTNPQVLLLSTENTMKVASGIASAIRAVPGILDWFRSIEGTWYFADSHTIRGWSCEPSRPERANTVKFTFGVERLWRGDSTKIKADQPSNAFVNAECGGDENNHWNHGFEYQLTDENITSIRDGDGKVYVFGLGRFLHNRKRLLNITGDTIDERIEGGGRSHDSSSSADIMQFIEQDLNEVEQEIMMSSEKKLDDGW